MFGKTKPTALPSHQVVADLAADALLGTLTMDISTGYALVATFKRYNADPKQQAAALVAFADILSQRHPLIAGQLVDLLAARVGK